MRAITTEHQLCGRIAVDLAHVSRVQEEQGDGAGSRRLEGPAGDHAQQLEQRAIHDGVEDRPAHGGGDLRIGDRRHRLDPQLLQVVAIDVVVVLDLEPLGPLRRPVPALADEGHSADPVPHRLQRPQHLRHAMPAELGVADIDHVEFLAGEIERRLPGRIVDVKQERPDIRPPRTHGGLANLVGEAVAEVDPLAARLRGAVIVVAGKLDGVVVAAVAIDHDTAPAGDRGQQPGPIQAVAELQRGGPLEDEDDCVSAGEVLRVVEPECVAGGAVNRHVVAHCPGRSRIPAQVQHAPGVLETPVHEHHLHRAPRR